MALRKAQKQLEIHGTAELQAQVEQLSLSAEQAKEALASATAASSSKAASISADDELKRLKIASSMARVALTKAQKQLDTHGTEELQAQVEQLRVSAEQAQQALEAATRAPDAAKKPAKPELSATEQAIKKAKIETAMKRAALRKAERAEADAETLSALQAELSQAEQELDTLNQTEKADV